MKSLKVLLIIFALALFANAQKVVLTGKVSDISQAVIPSAQITVTSKGGKIYKLVTNDYGEYEANLPAGEYTIDFSRNGFKELKVINIALSNSNKELNVTLQVARCEDCRGAIYGERWDDNTRISGTIYDTNGIPVENAKIVFLDSKNKQKTIFTNKDGRYEDKIPNDIYTIQVEATGFKVFKVERYKTVGTEKGLTFDVVLDVKDCDDPTVRCTTITSQPK